MEHSAGEHVIFEGHPSWRSTMTYYVKALAVILVVCAILALVTSVGLAIGAALVLGGLAIVAGYFRRMATTYTITNQRLRIKRGVIARKTQEARLERVQNVNTEQGVLERALRIGTVDFDTAGHDDAGFTFVGVASPDGVVSAVDEAQREFRATAEATRGTGV